MCYVDPYDPENQVRFYRQDPTGRIVPLEDTYSGADVQWEIVTWCIALGAIVWFVWWVLG